MLATWRKPFFLQSKLSSLSILAPVHLSPACLVLRLLVQTEIDTEAVIDTEVVTATMIREGSF